MSEVCAPIIDNGINALQRKRLCQLRTAFYCAFAGVAAMVSTQFVGMEEGSTQASLISRDIIIDSPETNVPIMPELTTTTTLLELAELPGYTTNAKILNDLLLCETLGDYQANTGNGYYGGYQFTVETWQALDTGYARADYAPAGVQDAAALEAARIGGGFHDQFPGCAEKLGLPELPFSE